MDPPSLSPHSQNSQQHSAMTSWGYAIMIVAVILGLNRSLASRHRYALAIAAATTLVLYAALRQHTY
jgi:hypothetical protein